MSLLSWIGKEKVVNHDKDLPFRVLKSVKDCSVGEDSGNLLIEGDNLMVVPKVKTIFPPK
jgi:adenine-specific DNA-methyltransferase